MGRHTTANKRKNSSDGTSGQLKNARNGGSPVNVSVSDSIHNANSVLYGENSESEISDLDLDNSVFGTLEGSIMSDSEKQSAVGTMEDSGPVASPSNSDILKYLKRMD